MYKSGGGGMVTGYGLVELGVPLVEFFWGASSVLAERI